jgi:ADP-dependent NAD(P)H-hydrate dehydratase / NAD(P)H-hydrate epimerase
VNRHLSGDKIITSQEMLRVEKEAYTRGKQAEGFMNQAGHNIAALVEDYSKKNNLSRTVFLLAGKGNKGGDGYTAGLELVRRGFIVQSLQLYPFDQCSELCKAKAEKFLQGGGKVRFLSDHEVIEFPKEGVILDALLGTGFKGKAEGIVAHVIAQANQTSIPIIAIDIPSGVSGDTGEVGSVAIRATMTIYLGMPKVGFFLRQGYEHIGVLKKAEFGLDLYDIEHAHAEGILIDPHFWPSLLPPISRTQHKYQRGYVLVWAGSPTMPGASMLTSMGALRGGAGIVRLFHAKGMASQLTAAPWELIKQPVDVQEMYKESSRAGCIVIGPGLGRERETHSLFKKIITKIKRPFIIDADGLYFLAKDLKMMPSQAILTPHRGEVSWLIGPTSSEAELIQKAQSFVDKYEVALICKGAPTVLFYPGLKPLLFAVGSPGMATAGAGDVLTGILGALCAAGAPLLDAAIAGICVHGKAGEIAATKKGPRSLIASDLLEMLPEAYSNPLFQHSY